MVPRDRILRWTLPSSTRCKRIDSLFTRMTNDNVVFSPKCERKPSPNDHLKTVFFIYSFAVAVAIRQKVKSTILSDTIWVCTYHIAYQLYNTNCAAAMHRYCHSAHFIRSNSQLIFLFGLWNLVSDPAPKLSIRFHLVLGPLFELKLYWEWWSVAFSRLGILCECEWVCVSRVTVSYQLCICYCMCVVSILLTVSILWCRRHGQIWFFFHFSPVFSLCRGLQGFEFNSIHFYSIVDMHIGYIERGKMRTESAHTSVNK